MVRLSPSSGEASKSTAGVCQGQRTYGLGCDLGKDSALEKSKGRGFQPHTQLPPCLGSLLSFVVKGVFVWEKGASSIVLGRWSPALFPRGNSTLPLPALLVTDSRARGRGKMEEGGRALEVSEV